MFSKNPKNKNLKKKIDEETKEKLPANIKNIQSVDLIPYRKVNKWGFIDKTGKEVIPCKYDYVGLFSGSFAVVELK